MPIDLKYGRVELENKPASMADDEPVVVFRAQDKLVPKLLAYYRLFCWKSGSPQEHLRKIDDVIAEFEQWQKANPEQAKIPD